MTPGCTNAELERLLGFIGYGRLDAPVWFLGMEEAGGGEDNLRRRTQFAEVMDLKEAHLKLRLPEFFVGEKPVIQRTWWGMCQVMLRLLGQPTDRESVRGYQVNLLGRTDGQTMLLSVLPLPKHNDSEWGYKKILPQYPTRAAYLNRVMRHKMARLTGLVFEHKPQVVVAFGRAYWADCYEKLFLGTPWHSADRFRWGFYENTLVVLTDQFIARSMNGRWDELAALITARVPGITQALNKERI